jgi:hypothetical protein
MRSEPLSTIHQLQISSLESTVVEYGGEQRILLHVCARIPLLDSLDAFHPPCRALRRVADPDSVTPWHRASSLARPTILHRLGDKPAGRAGALCFRPVLRTCDLRVATDRETLNI